MKDCRERNDGIVVGAVWGRKARDRECPSCDPARGKDGAEL